MCDVWKLKSCNKSNVYWSSLAPSIGCQQSSQTLFLFHDMYQTIFNLKKIIVISFVILNILFLEVRYGIEYFFLIFSEKRTWPGISSVVSNVDRFTISCKNCRRGLFSTGENIFFLEYLCENV